MFQRAPTLSYHYAEIGLPALCRGNWSFWSYALSNWSSRNSTPSKLKLLWGKPISELNLVKKRVHIDSCNLLKFCRIWSATWTNRFRTINFQLVMTDINSHQKDYQLEFLISQGPFMRLCKSNKPVLHIEKSAILHLWPSMLAVTDSHSLACRIPSCPFLSPTTKSTSIADFPLYLCQRFSGIA